MRRNWILYAAAAVCVILLTASGPALAEKPILIGCPLPLTGPYASDGEQMKMALELAVAEKNAAGGLWGASSSSSSVMSADWRRKK